MAKIGKKFSGNHKSKAVQLPKESTMSLDDNEIPMLPVTDDTESEIPMLPVSDTLDAPEMPVTDEQDIPMLAVTDENELSVVEPEVPVLAVTEESESVVDDSINLDVVVASDDTYTPYVPEHPNSGLDINHAVIMPLDAMVGTGVLSLTQMMHLPTVRDVYWVCSECDTDTRKYRDGYHICASFDDGHVGVDARDKPVCPECAAVDAMVFHVDGGVPINTPVWDIEHHCWRANEGQVWDVSTQPDITHCPFCCSLAQINVVSPLLWDCTTCNVRLGDPANEVILPTPVV